MHPDWLVPKWPAPATVRAVCTTRVGGRSVAPYDSLNLGDHVGDDPLAVGANRAVLAQAIAARPVFLQQVHGRGVVTLDAHTLQGTEADACLTREPGVACTIMVADCLPLLFTDVRGSVVAAAHAGWRGLAGEGGVGVIETLYAALRVDAGELMVWLGPCIGPQAFEVGPEVKAAFEERNPGAASCFHPAAAPGKWLADLPALARLRLTALGIDQVYGNEGSAFWCTVTNPSRFFSHRRDRVSGRLAACIWLA
ncbi:MAG: peptidoglycan editing factor PgeF [Hylemonella sp.]|nr:peptidoglycan editing factor PgeF [Hylemonella sp.]